MEEKIDYTTFNDDEAIRLQIEEIEKMTQQNKDYELVQALSREGLTEDEKKSKKLAETLQKTNEQIKKDKKIATKLTYEVEDSDEDNDSYEIGYDEDEILNVKNNN